MNTTYSKLLAVVIPLAAASILFSACKKDNSTPFVPTEPVPEAIDLGLPSGTLWSSFNLGASAYGQHGKHYSWAETKAKNNYAWVNYIYRLEGDGDNNVKLSKYVTDDGYGEPDGKNFLDPQDDAAAVCLGGGWHLPTEEQCEELRNYCLVSVETIGGVKGVKFTSNREGFSDRSIFIPYDGYVNTETTIAEGSSVYLWTNKLSSTRYGRVCYHNGTLSFGGMQRNTGRTIRPVCQK